MIENKRCRFQKVLAQEVGEEVGGANYWLFILICYAAKPSKHGRLFCKAVAMEAYWTSQSLLPVLLLCFQKYRVFIVTAAK